MQELHLEPHEVIYVGDDPLLDVQAARLAGMPTAWMNRTRQVWPATVAPADINVADCLDLATQLGT
ncbi:MAG: HAD hydrolase-like protein, partial [Sinobacteraceae bacterium]|nr:HAD hydrolase-like protein [Nevskiaceae bacterium]